jgi:hypothetical protein
MSICKWNYRVPSALVCRDRLSTGPLFTFVRYWKNGIRSQRTYIPPGTVAAIRTAVVVALCNWRWQCYHISDVSVQQYKQPGVHADFYFPLFEVVHLTWCDFSGLNRSSRAPSSARSFVRWPPMLHPSCPGLSFVTRTGIAVMTIGQCNNPPNWEV